MKAIEATRTTRNVPGSSPITAIQPAGCAEEVIGESLRLDLQPHIQGKGRLGRGRPSMAPSSIKEETLAGRPKFLGRDEP